MFNDILYIQKDIVAMGSPLGPTMFTYRFMKCNGLNSAPMNSNKFFYRWYVDDVFILFESAEHLTKFHAYLNTCHHVFFIWTKSQ